MYHNIEEFLEEWKLEEALTLLIFSAISEDKKQKRANENVRSLEKLAWHITQTLTEMPFKAGIISEDALDKKAIPDSIEGIIDLYREHATKLKEALVETWSNFDLEEKIEVYDQEWERSKILSVLVKHQIHHRGQLTAYLRINGLPVPGTYGPSKEEWEKYGMNPQD